LPSPACIKWTPADRAVHHRRERRRRRISRISRARRSRAAPGADVAGAGSEPAVVDVRESSPHSCSPLSEVVDVAAPDHGVRWASR
jgi:hypothetical protein